jgi:transcriptional regulator with XRE-family HTH domain
MADLEDRERLLRALAENVRSTRERQGLSRPALAKRAGLSLSTIAAIENQRAPNPRVDTLFGVAVALDTPLPKLIQDSDK